MASEIETLNNILHPEHQESFDNLINGLACHYERIGKGWAGESAHASDKYTLEYVAKQLLSLMEIREAQATPNTAIEADVARAEMSHYMSLYAEARDKGDIKTMSRWLDEAMALINTQAEERATARVKAFAEELKKYNGAYINMNGRRVDNMVHHQVIDEVLTKYTKGGAQ